MEKLLVLGLCIATFAISESTADDEQHYIRCYSTISKAPLCRKEECEDDEIQLTAVPVKSWKTKAECLKQLYWGRACYFANNNPPHYMEIKPAMDYHYGGLCDTGSVVVSKGFLSADSPAALKEKCTKNYLEGGEL